MRKPFGELEIALETLEFLLAILVLGNLHSRFCMEIRKNFLFLKYRIKVSRKGGGRGGEGAKKAHIRLVIINIRARRKIILLVGN